MSLCETMTSDDVVRVRRTFEGVGSTHGYDLPPPLCLILILVGKLGRHGKALIPII